MNPLTRWAIWWRMWLVELPRCEDDWRQGGRTCNCQGKHALASKYSK
jgi:hypothetical protein